MGASKLCFLDTETTGLDPELHEILEVAAVVTDLTAETVFVTYEARLAMLRPHEASPEALKINRYADKKDLPTVPHQEVAQALVPLLDGATVVGHNPSFDKAFIKAFFKEHGLQPKWDYHAVDTVSLAWPLFRAGKIPRMRLGEVCAYLGVVNTDEHSALADTVATREVYRRLMSQYMKALA